MSLARFVGDQDVQAGAKNRFLTLFSIGRALEVTPLRPDEERGKGGTQLAERLAIKDVFLKYAM
jgi:hypothetical protein